MTLFKLQVTLTLTLSNKALLQVLPALAAPLSTSRPASYDAVEIIQVGLNQLTLVATVPPAYESPSAFLQQLKADTFALCLASADDDESVNVVPSRPNKPSRVITYVDVQGYSSQIAITAATKLMSKGYTGCGSRLRAS